MHSLGVCLFAPRSSPTPGCSGRFQHVNSRITRLELASSFSPNKSAGHYLRIKPDMAYDQDVGKILPTVMNLLNIKNLHENAFSRCHHRLRSAPGRGSVRWWYHSSGTFSPGKLVWLYACITLGLVWRQVGFSFSLID